MRFSHFQSTQVKRGSEMHQNRQYCVHSLSFFTHNLPVREMNGCFFIYTFWCLQYEHKAFRFHWSLPVCYEDAIASFDRRKKKYLQWFYAIQRHLSSDELLILHLKIHFICPVGWDEFFFNLFQTKSHSMSFKYSKGTALEKPVKNLKMSLFPVF